jgi:RHS repeat-associated protein
MRSALGSGFLLLALLAPAGRAGAAPGPRGAATPAQEQPLERQWIPYTLYADNGPSSVAVDSQGKPRIVWVVHLPDYALHYAENAPDSEDYTSSIIVRRIDFPNASGMSFPDVWVDQEDKVHIIWIHSFVNPDGTYYNRIYWRVKTPFGWEGAVLTPEDLDMTRTQYACCQINVGPDGVVHVMAVRKRHDGAKAIVHITRTPEGQKIVNVLPVTNPDWGVRFALKGNSLCAVWHETLLVNPEPTPKWEQHIYASTAAYEGGATDWSAKALLSIPREGVNNWNGDVAFKASGAPHFAWLQVFPNNTRRIMHMKAGGTPTAVSSTPPDPQSLVSPLLLVDSSDRVNIFYEGVCHARGDGDGGGWTRAEPIRAPTSAPSYVIKDQLEEVALGPDGNFHLVAEGYYTRTTSAAFGFEGMHPVPAFPGGSVNVIDGGLLARIDLFETQGTGPSLGMGLNYNSKAYQSTTLLSPGWKLDYQMSIISHGSLSSPTGPLDHATLLTPGGQAIHFTEDKGINALVADPEMEFPGRLGKYDGKWGILMEGGMRYLFNVNGRLDTVLHPTGNFIKLEYDDTGRPIKIIDMLGNGGPGRVTRLEYTDLTAPSYGRRLTAITDPGGARYELGYTGGNLSSVAFTGHPARPTYEFEYERVWLMNRFIPPRGRASVPKYGYTIGWDGAARVTSVTDPEEAFLLDGEGDLVTPSPRVASMGFFYSDSPQVVSGMHTRVHDRRGFDTIYAIDAYLWKVTEIWDAAAITGVPGIGPVVRVYDPNYKNLLEETDRWGFSTKYTYVPKTPLSPAPWLRNLLATVERPKPDGPGHEKVLEIAYTDDTDGVLADWGLVKRRTTYVTPVGAAVPVERTTAFGYNAFGQLVSVRHPDLTRPDNVGQNDVFTRFEYDGPRKQLTRVVNEETHWTEYGSFHPFHGLPRSVLRQGGKVPSETLYDLMGNVTATKLPPGGPGSATPGWTVNELDGLYRVVSVTDPAGHMTFNEYDVESRLVSVQPPAGGPTLTFYDRRGFVSGSSSPDGTWSQWVDANGNVRRKRSLRGFEANTDYDELGRAVETRVPGASTRGGGDGGGGPTMTTRFVHDGFDPLTSEHFSTETDVGIAPHPDRVTRTVFDNRGRKKKVIAPDGNPGGLTGIVTRNFYNEIDQPVATEAHYNNVFQTCTVTYRDARDRVERVRVQNAPYGDAPAEWSDTWTLYNKAGSVVQTVDPLGSVTAAGYAHKRTFILDERERVVHEVDGEGVIVKENIYGDDDLLVEVRLPDPETKGFNLVTSEFRTYTARKELRTSLNRDGNGLTYAYNAIQGQVDTVTDALDRRTKTTYWEATQRVKEVIVAWMTDLARTTTSVWENGLLKETHVYNPETPTQPAVYRQFYDQANRLERFEAPLVAAERHSYNEFGEESRFVAGLKAVDHAYSVLGQRTGSTWTGSHSASEGRTYNGLGLLESVTAQGRGKVMTYDLWQGTLNTETFYVGGQAWKTQIHVYDVAKNYTHFTDAEGGQHEWLYDPNNRVYQIKYGTALVATIHYTPGGMVDWTTLHDATGAEIARTTLTYDRLGLKVRSQTVRTGGETVADFGWVYDELDLVRKIQYLHLGVEMVLDYNERRELVGESLTSNNGGNAAPPHENAIGPAIPNPIESGPVDSGQASLTGHLPIAARTATYEFDPAGNRLWHVIAGVRTDFVYNSASQLVSEAAPGKTVSHEYDEWGNEKVCTTTQGGATTTETYGYNYLNLMSLYAPQGGASWQYDFWPTGEKYAKTNLGDSHAELYIPRGGDVATEYEKLGAAPPTHKNSYAQGTGIDQKYVRIPANSGPRRHYLGDQVGTLSITLTDVGAVAEVGLKDAWGVQLSGGTPSERYGYAQREHDLESGLVHMRARMYDPRTGRFTQNDPIVGNRPAEHYVYGANNPLTNIDPMGTQESPYNGPGGYYDEKGLRHQSFCMSCHGDNPVAKRRIESGRLVWRLMGEGAEAAGGVALMGTGVGAPAGAYLVMDAGSAYAGEFDPDLDFVQKGHEYYFGEKGATFSRPLTALAVSLTPTSVGWRTASKPAPRVTVPDEFSGVPKDIPSGPDIAVPGQPIPYGPILEPEGSFSLTKLGWAGYPQGVPKPTGTFRILTGKEYEAARIAANRANRAIHAADPSTAGLQIHEIKPVKFGGSPTNPANKIPVAPAIHSTITNWWNRLARALTP